MIRTAVLPLLFLLAAAPGYSQTVPSTPPLHWAASQGLVEVQLFFSARGVPRKNLDQDVERKVGINPLAHQPLVDGPAVTGERPRGSALGARIFHGGL